MKQKLLFILALLLTAVTGAWADVVASGYCGKQEVNNGQDLTWTLTSEGVLTISGTGEMKNCSDGSHSPWYNYMKNVTSVVIGDGVTNISDWAFSHQSTETDGSDKYTNLTSLTIGNDVTSIGEWAFYGCTGLTSIVIPNSVQTLKAHAFEGCSGVTSLTIGRGISVLNQRVFAGLGITSVVIPASVNDILDGIFDNCSNLSTVIVESASMIGYGSDVFNNNAPGRKILVYYTGVNNFKAGWSSYQSDIIGFTATGTCGTTGHESDVVWALAGTNPYTLYICGNGDMMNYSDTDLTLAWKSWSSNITSVVVGSGVTTIGQYAFYQCTNLSLVTFAENSQLEYIYPNAFYQCSNLASITLPASVKGVANLVFSGCTKLTSITLNSNPTIYTYDFPAGATVTMNLTAHPVATTAGTDYWMTFYNNAFHFKADDNTTVYKATLNGSSLQLTEVADRIVTQGNAVILKSTGNPTMTRNSTGSSDTNSNDLKGGPLDDTTCDAYTLSRGSTGTGTLGFYKYSGTSLDGNKAHLEIPKTGGAPEFVGFGDEETTKISRPTPNPSLYGGEWYDLQGRKVNGKPTKKGVYVRNGQKVVIK